jgi:hypothetical protein
MSEPVQKYRALVKSLYNKTQRRELDWKVAQNESVTCKLGSYSIKIQGTRNAENVPFETVQVRNALNQTIDSFDDDIIKGEEPGLANVTSYYDLMVALRRAAHRYAVGADEALDNILRELEEDDSQDL